MQKRQFGLPTRQSEINRPLPPVAPTFSTRALHDAAETVHDVAGDAGVSRRSRMRYFFAFCATASNAEMVLRISFDVYVGWTQKPSVFRINRLATGIFAGRGQMTL